MHEGRVQGGQAQQRQQGEEDGLLMDWGGKERIFFLFCLFLFCFCFVLFVCFFILFLFFVLFVKAADKHRTSTKTR